MAQVIVATQMVLEEKFVSKHDVHPLRAVGTEGFMGHGEKGGVLGWVLVNRGGKWYGEGGLGGVRG